MRTKQQRQWKPQPPPVALMRGARRWLTALLWALAAAVWSQGVLAQQPELIARNDDWDAYRIRGPNGELTCYMLTIPKEKVPKNVRRGDVFFLLTHRPSENIRDEASIITGYQYRTDSVVNATISDQTFDFFTQGDGAWLYDEEAERSLVRAMQRGLEMVVQGQSSRGTTTIDTYSLLGFTATYEAISNACSVAP